MGAYRMASSLPSRTVRCRSPGCSSYAPLMRKPFSSFGPNLLSEVLKETEKRQGRTHNEDGIVTLDLDLLQYDDERFHHRDWERPYVKNLINEL